MEFCHLAVIGIVERTVKAGNHFPHFWNIFRVVFFASDLFEHFTHFSTGIFGVCHISLSNPASFRKIIINICRFFRIHDFFRTHYKTIQWRIIWNIRCVHFINWNMFFCKISPCQHNNINNNQKQKEKGQTGLWPKSFFHWNYFSFSHDCLPSLTLFLFFT